MPSQPLLSICIPTYNRKDLLRVCLDSIFLQVTGTEMASAIEVVVSDNASADSTGQLIKDYQNRHPELKYFRNSENIGGDLNLANSVVKATGKYAWYLGDDDALAPGVLKYVLGILQKFQPAVVGVKSADFLPADRVPGPEFQIIDKQPIVVDDFREFMEKGYCLGILSVILFDRDLWLQVDRTVYHPIWLYYEIVLKLMPKAAGRNFVYVDQVGVLTGAGYSWIKNGGELFTFLDWKEILNSLADYGYNKIWIQSEQKNFPKRLLLVLLQAKGHDLPKKLKNLKRIYKSFPDNPFYLALATIIFYVPNFAVKFARDTKKALAG